MQTDNFLFRTFIRHFHTLNTVTNISKKKSLNKLHIKKKCEVILYIMFKKKKSWLTSGDLNNCWRAEKKLMCTHTNECFTIKATKTGTLIRI